MGRLDGKTALVTGGSRGIGRAIVVELAREGARVALNYQANDAKAQAVADEVAAFGGAVMLVKANVGNAAEARAMVKQVADEFGRLDILVNNAGITRDSSLKKMTDEQWDEVVKTNLGGYFYCTSAAIPVMTAQKFGRIINISSMNGQIAAFGQANYSASKGGIIAFTKTAALELAKSGITVNTVSPGFTETECSPRCPRKSRSRSRAGFRWAASPSRRRSPRRLSSWRTDGDYITGQQINVNGGAFM